jgi:hypothetical protein
MEFEKPQQREEGTAYKDMQPAQKVKFILKLIVCILTFGMAFPNVMSD